MDIGLKGKVVGVAGASRGIGGEAASAFAREGANLIICARSADGLNRKKEELESLGAMVYADICDVTDSNAVREFITKAAEFFGSIDIWMNSAGTDMSADILDLRLEDWDAVFAVNLKPALYIAQSLFPYMKTKGGSIINISSWMSIIPRAGFAAYAASKAALTSLTRTTAAEFAPYKIRVNALIPGFITTELTQNSKDIAANAGVWQCTAFQRPGVPAELIGPIMFLASDMSSFVTGTTLDVSGGKLIVQNPEYPWRHLLRIEDT